jgi:hypothetical protein
LTDPKSVTREGAKIVISAGETKQTRRGVGRALALFVTAGLPNE